VILDLVRYAEREGLVTEPGFGAQAVKWALLFSEDGRFLGVAELGDASDPRNRGRVFPKCSSPKRQEYAPGSIQRSRFLADDASTVALYRVSEKDAAKRAEGHAFFVRLLRDASTVLPELGAVATALEDDTVLDDIGAELTRQKARPGDYLTVRVGSRFPLDANAWHDWWREVYYREFRGATPPPALLDGPGGRFRCLVSGELVEPAPGHPSIKRLNAVGGGGNEILVMPLPSYGLEEYSSCAVSDEIASTYSAGLQNLVDEHKALLAGAMVVHWFRRRVPPEDDPLGWFEGPDAVEVAAAQQRAAEALAAIETGKRPDLADNEYYALTMRAVRQRVIVLDWMVGPFTDLVRAYDRWVGDLSVTNIGGSDLARAPSLERVLTAGLPPRKREQEYKDWVKPVGALRVGLWRAAVEQARIPRGAVPRVLSLHGSVVASGLLDAVLADPHHGDRPLILSALYARLGLLKAYHLRKNRQKGGCDMPDDLQPYLNENHPSTAYHCGRLMAVLARLQHRALGDVGAGVVQRYYAAASSTPALVLGRLVRMSQHHLAKLEGGLAHWFESIIADIHTKLGDGPPRTLDLEEQSLFALGYYQQIAHMSTKRAEGADDAQPTEGESPNG